MWCTFRNLVLVLFELTCCVPQVDSKANFHVVLVKINCIYSELFLIVVPFCINYAASHRNMEKYRTPHTTHFSVCATKIKHATQIHATSLRESPKLQHRETLLCACQNNKNTARMIHAKILLE
jgi:hypothetical protein